MLITVFQSPKWLLQIASFVQLTVQTQKSLHSLFKNRNKSSKSLFVRNWKQQMFDMFAWKMTCMETINQLSKVSMRTYCWGVSRAWSRYGRGATQEGVGECWPVRQHMPQDHCWPRQSGRYKKPLGLWCHLHPQASDESATKPRKEMC